jgi:hypothetical protein
MPIWRRQWVSRVLTWDGLCRRQSPCGNFHVIATAERIIVEAEVVYRIFEEYVAGRTPREIAYDPNNEGISPRRGRSWNASTIKSWLTPHRVANKRAATPIRTSSGGRVTCCRSPPLRSMPCGDVNERQLHPSVLARYEQQFVQLQDVNAGGSEAAEAIRDLVETVTPFASRRGQNQSSGPFATSSRPRIGYAFLCN